MNYIPQQLKELPRWVIWKIEHVRSDRTTKVPYQARNPDRRASVSNPATWATYDMAMEAAADPDVAGIGIVLGCLGDGRNLCGVDLDGCLFDGVMNPEAQSIVKALPTYWEISPSRTGLKSIGFGSKPEDTGAVCTDASFERIEVYDSGRWFAVTGHLYDGEDLQDVERPLAALCREWGLTRERRRDAPPPILRASGDTSGAEDRAAAYLATMDPAVEGSSGHSSLFKAACAMAWGFDLGREASIRLLAAEFNPRCSPPWDLGNISELREFERKVDQALQAKHEQPRGHLINDVQFAAPTVTINTAALLASAASRMATPEPVEEPMPEPSKGGIAKRLLQPPGLLGRITGWINATANNYQPEFAMGNAIAFTGALVGRKLATENDGRTNFYCVGLGASGCGKDHSRKQIARLAEASGVTHHLAGEDVTSDTALLRVASENPSVLLQLDEIGHFMSANKSRNASTHEMKIVPLLTKLFTSANSKYRGKEYADATDKPRVDIDQPNVCLYGTATPKQVWDSLSTSQIEDGFIGRLLIFTTTDNDPDWREVDDKAPPRSLVESVAAWSQFQPQAPQGAGNLVQAKPKAMRVQATDEAAEVLERFRDDARAAKRKLMDKHEPTYALWVRAAEQAWKLALLASADTPQGGMTIGREAAEWAVGVTDYLIRDLIAHTAGKVVDSAHQRDLVDVLASVRASGIKGVTKSDLLRSHRKIKTRDMDEILKRLVDEGVAVNQILAHEGAGRPTSVYTAV